MTISAEPIGAGRYAPSPSGDLHIGNLRTAILAWALARQTGRDFLLRVEDLDRSRAVDPAGQLRDLAAIGVTWSEPVVYQTERVAHYRRVIDELAAAGRVYECYCSRRDIQAAASAPHAAPGAYPGTCRDMSPQLREAKRAQLADQGRLPALRLAADTASFTVHDRFAGSYTGVVDDFVLRRGDGVIAYNLAVVVDDAAAGVDQVCRGDDLLSSAPRQAYLGQLLGYGPVTYAHVPLVLNERGERLAKRDGAVTLADLERAGWGVHDVLEWIATSVGAQPRPGQTLSAADIGAAIDWERVTAGPVVFRAPQP